jgi:hypothetical protein
MNELTEDHDEAIKVQKDFDGKIEICSSQNSTTTTTISCIECTTNKICLISKFQPIRNDSHPLLRRSLWDL